MGCLDEETIAAFAEARLPPEAITRLEAHVRGCASCRDLVSLSLAAAAGGAATPGGDGASPRGGGPGAAPASAGVELARGASVGRYTVLTLLGRGGMGEVYAAYDPELDRKIALKILHGDGDANDGRGGSRLLREAKSIARLRHPNVVLVHDAGSVADRVFIAMEHVDGQTLAAWLAERGRTQRQILDVFRHAGRGLQAAHAAGLVHRDFKPQNVMVGSDGEVRVMDFGLARAVDAPVDAAEAGGAPAAARLDIGLTRTGELIGTPLYMAPEQFAGRRTDARTDQFSFCVALYQALYGAHPFGGSQLGQLIAAVTEERVQPAPPRSAVAPWLRRIMLRGLSRDPDARYPSMTALLAALGRERAQRRRRLAALGAGALLVAVLAAGAQRVATRARATCDGGPARSATVWTAARRATLEKTFTATGSRHAAQAIAGTVAALDTYVSRWRGLFEETCEATHVRGEQSMEVLDLRMACLDERLASVRALVDTLASADAKMVDRAVIATGALPALEPCSDVAALRAIVRPPDDQAKRRAVADARDRLAAVNALSSAGRCDQATRLGRPLLETARQIGYLPLLAETAYALGHLFDICVDAKQAVADLEDAVMAAESSRDDAVAIEAAAMLASAYADRMHDIRAAHQWLRLAEAILARFPGHPRLDARVAAARGVVLFDEGRLEDALAEDRRALALQEVLLGPSSIEAVNSHNNIATVLHDLGRDREAEVNIRRGLEIIASTTGDDTDFYALMSVNGAEVLTGLGKFEAAHAAIERALAIWRAQDASGFLIGYGLLDQGKLELAEGRPRVAVTTLDKAVSLVAGQDPRTTGEALFALARALVAASPDNQGRASGLARKALATLGGELSAARLIRDIERWQREHPAP